MSNAHLASRTLRRIRSRVVYGMALLAAASACGQLHHGEEDDPAPPAYLVFVNQSLEQADVFAIGPAGDATRIGTVQPGRTETLEIPERITGRGPINITARLLTRGTLQSGPVSFNSGDRLQATVSLDARSMMILPMGPQN